MPVGMSFLKHKLVVSDMSIHIGCQHVEYSPSIHLLTFFIGQLQFQTDFYELFVGCCVRHHARQRDRMYLFTVLTVIAFSQEMALAANLYQF